MAAEAWNSSGCYFPEGRFIFTLKHLLHKIITSSFSFPIILIGFIYPSTKTQGTSSLLKSSLIPRNSQNLVLSQIIPIISFPVQKFV